MQTLSVPVMDALDWPLSACGETPKRGRSEEAAEAPPGPEKRHCTAALGDHNFHSSQMDHWVSGSEWFSEPISMALDTQLPLQGEDERQDEEVDLESLLNWEPQDTLDWASFAEQYGIYTEPSVQLSEAGKYQMSGALLVRLNIPQIWFTALKTPRS